MKTVKCIFTLHAQNLELWKTLTAHEFARNVKCLTSQIHILILSATWRVPNRFEPLVKKANKYPNPLCSKKPTSINGLKFASININSIRGKKLELVAFLDFYKPDVVAIQEIKIDETISSAELFPDSCPYNAYRKDRNLLGGGVMLLIN